MARLKKYNWMQVASFVVDLTFTIKSWFDNAAHDGEIDAHEIVDLAGLIEPLVIKHFGEPEPIGYESGAD